MDKQHGKRVRRTKGGNTHQFIQSNTKKKKYQIPGHDGIHGFWFKFTSIHDRLAIKMNKCLQEAHVPKWMTIGKRILIQKDPLKGTTLNNYKPMTCLSMMWKILTVQIRKEIYDLLISHGLFPEEQKGCCKWTRSTGELLNIDQNNLQSEQDETKKSSYGMD